MMDAPEHLTKTLDAALAGYQPGIDRAVKFVTVDQVDMLTEFYLHNRRADLRPRVKALVWETDGPDELVTDGYRIITEGYTHRLFFGEMQLTTSRDDSGIARLQEIADRHHERRILAALEE